MLSLSDVLKLRITHHLAHGRALEHLDSAYRSDSEDIVDFEKLMIPLTQKNDNTRYAHTERLEKKLELGKSALIAYEAYLGMNLTTGERRKGYNDVFKIWRQKLDNALKRLMDDAGENSKNSNKAGQTSKRGIKSSKHASKPAFEPAPQVASLLDTEIGNKAIAFHVLFTFLKIQNKPVSFSVLKNALIDSKHTNAIIQSMSDDGLRNFLISSGMKPIIQRRYPNEKTLWPTQWVVPKGWQDLAAQSQTGFKIG